MSLNESHPFSWVRQTAARDPAAATTLNESHPFSWVRRAAIGGAALTAGFGPQ